MRFGYRGDAAPGVSPLLLSVSDWFEHASCDQVSGFEQGEAPSVTVVIDNRSALAELDLDYAVRATCRLFDDSGAEVLFGSVTRCAYGTQLQLTVEA